MVCSLVGLMAVPAAAQENGFWTGGEAGLDEVNVGDRISLSNDLDGDKVVDADPIYALTADNTVDVYFGLTGMPMSAAQKVATTPTTVTVDAVDPFIEDSGGTFSCSFIVPKVPGQTAEGGLSYRIWVDDGVKTPAWEDIKVQTSLKLYAGASEISPLVPIAAGTTVTAKGYAFHYGVGVNIKNEAGIPVASGVTGADGYFETTFTASATNSGDLTARDTSASGNTATATVNLRPGVVLTPGTGKVGTTITVSGSFFTGSTLMGDGAYGIKVGYGDFVNPTTQNWPDAMPGTFTAKFTIPVGAPTGQVQVTVQDNLGSKGTALLTVSAHAVNVQPPSGVVGTTVSLTGSSFTRGGTIPGAPEYQDDPRGIWYGTKRWTTTPIQITTTGDWATTLVIQDNATYGMSVTPGAKGISVVDSGYITGAGVFTLATPTLTMAQTTGVAGSMVTFEASGFRSLGTVNVRITGWAMETSPVRIATCDASGNAAGSFTIPQGTAAGVQMVTATDAIDPAIAASVDFTVPPQWIQITPVSGASGDIVNISGEGFTGYTALTVLAIGNINVMPATGAATDAFGTFTADVMVPQLPEGVVIVTATAGVTGTTTFTVTVAPTTVKTALAGIMDELVIVWYYDNVEVEWFFYDKLDPGSDLISLLAGGAYWIKVDADVELIFGGHKYVLGDGWNGVGWLGL